MFVCCDTIPGWLFVVQPDSHMYTYNSVLWLAVVTDSHVVSGCLLIDLVMLIDTYRSMIVRFVSPATRDFLLPLLSLSCLLVVKENLWDQGSKTVFIRRIIKYVDLLTSTKYLI